jgi:type I restriction enzyme S subunit
MMTGVTGRMRLSSRDLGAFQIAYPSIGDQQRIVEILEDHFSRLDFALKTLGSAAIRLRPLVSTLLQKIVPAGETKGWSLTTVGEAGRVQLGRQRHPEWHTGPEMMPYLRVANVFEDRIDTRDLMEMDFSGVFERYQLAPGDVLLNEGQSPEFLGRPAIYRGEPPEVAFTNSLIRFKASSAVLPEWALLVFRRHMHAGRFMKESRITTNIAHLSASRLKNVEFPVPPLEEQQALVDLANDLLSTIERFRVELARRRKQERVLRRSLLEAAFSGRLTRRSADHRVIEEHSYA